jgi:hypothetical protein
MPSNEQLGTYLNDHLAGAGAGVELAEKLDANYQGTPFGTAVAAVAGEIKADRDTLQALMERLGIEGKLALWQALKGIDGLDTELGRADFDRLIFRARQQREALEPHGWRPLPTR